MKLGPEARKCPACAQRFSQDAQFCPFDGAKLEAGAPDSSGDSILKTTIDGRYEVLDLLGEGGTGRVYKVRHVVLNRLFAMKLLRQELVQDVEIAARFIQEAKATASIRHPNVVGINDFGVLPGGVPFLVTELLVGQTLREVIRACAPMPPLRVARIVKQIAGALGAAHAAGVVHRDLKPENVFLVAGPSAVAGSTADEVRVVDFGAAKVIGASRLTRDGVVFGTPHYMSPEQASGQPIDHRADLYSLGIIMYEMFTGRVPFEADTYMGVLTQHMFVQPVPPSQVALLAGELGGLERITLACLAKTPDKRYASMDSLTVEIDQASSVLQPRDGPMASLGTPFTADDGTETPRHAFLGSPWFLRGATERERSRAWAVAGGLVLACLALAWAWLHAGGEGVARLSAAAVSLDGGAAAVRANAPVSLPLPAVSVPPQPVAPSGGGAVAGTTSPPLSATRAPQAAAVPARATPDVQRRVALPSNGAVFDDVGDPFAKKR